MNSCNFAGNLTKDPELKYTNSGTAILNFSLAVNDRVKVGDEWKDKPNYFDIVVWGKRGEGLSRHLSKGMKVAVQCRAEFQSWESEGKRRSKIQFVAVDVDLMSKGGGQSQSISTQSNNQQEYSDGPFVDDEDVPF